jgi:predicted dehydrogenase
MSEQKRNIMKTSSKENLPVETLSRRSFLGTTSQAATLSLLGGSIIQAIAGSLQTVPDGKKIRVGIIGCGKVSKYYLINMKSRPFIELVSCCDIIRSRAEDRAKQYDIPHVYGHINEMLKGADFDLLVNTTSMTSHFDINTTGLEAGKHVWTEKPMADTVEKSRKLLELSKKHKVGFWAAPCMVTSPQFEFMARSVADGKLGRLAGARAFYGHNGHSWFWAPEFLMKGGGGCLYDLGVYNITTLTGILGPVRRVCGMTSILHPQATVRIPEGGELTVKVEAEENAMLVMDHGNGIFSQVMTGFSLFDKARRHDELEKEKYTLEIFGDGGVMNLVGYDWGPAGVDLATKDEPMIKRYCTDRKGFTWEQGASYVAERLLTGERSLITAEHALHCIDIMSACVKSSRTGKYVDTRTSFEWPVFKS